MDNKLWTHKPYAYGQAWVDLLLLANHETKTGFYQGKEIEFKRGTVYRSILSLGERWGWDRKKVRKYLKFLELEKMATTISTTHGTTITIVNYALYQDVGSTNGTTNVPTAPQPFPTNNHYNNYNKEKINKPSSTKHQYGTYKNVLMTDEEMEKLKNEFPTDWEQRIETLSEGIEVHGYKYKNHLAVIRKWAKKDSQEGTAKDDANEQLRKEWAKSDSFFTGFE